MLHNLINISKVKESTKLCRLTEYKSYERNVDTMGLSSSQGRLLSITARLTSNEYESQQISNAKMRLATQSQAASDDYINALNSQQVLYTTYDERVILQQKD